MYKLIVCLLAATIMSCRPSANTDTASGNTESGKTKQIGMGENTCLLHYDSEDEHQARQIATWLKQGHKTVHAFFGRDFNRKFDIHIFRDRESLDKQWQKDWNMPEFKSQCWMVASGVAHRLDILSPRVWETQACEHDNKDTLATKKIITHELVHVFHGQNNPSPTFDDIVNIDWFVEGIAVYASGQLDGERRERTRDCILRGECPAKLSDVWKGENKYGFAGSLIKFIDDKYGRDVLVDLLKYTNATEILKILDVSEEELLEQWKQSVR